MIGIDKAKAYLKGFGEKLGICNQVNLLIIRDMMTKDSTLGKLYLDGEYICETLELPWVDNK